MASLSCDSRAHRQSLEKKRYAALESWTDALESVHSAVTAKIARGPGFDGPMGMGVPDPYGMRDWAT
jgi:hypothetical protein